MDMIKMPLTISRFQVGLFLLFLTINVTLLAFAQPTVVDQASLHPAYAFAPDGTRYWHPALSLVHDRSFSYITADGQWHALARGGPIPPIFYATFIYTFGFESAPYYFIPVQCALLYGLGLQARVLAGLFKANKNLVQVLIVINPNLIGIAHFAQSEALFCFFFASLIITIALLIVGKDKSGLVNRCLLIGLLSGIAVLIRPTTFFYALLLPFMVIAFYSWPRRQKLIVWLREASLIFALITISSAITISPWAIRNSLSLGNYSVVQGSIGQLEDTLARMLVKNGVGNDTEVRNLIAGDLEEIAIKNNFHLACFGRGSDVEMLDSNCKNQIIEAYIRLFASQPLSFIVNGLLFATVSTYFAGGATAIANTLGMDHASEKIMQSEFSGLSTFRTFAMGHIGEFTGYIFLMLITALFASLCRLLGLVGVLTATKFEIPIRLQLFCIVTVIIFTATFMFTGVSRFRAPLEIILMTYGGLGITTLSQALKFKKSRKCRVS